MKVKIKTLLSTIEIYLDSYGGTGLHKDVYKEAEQIEKYLNELERNGIVEVHISLRGKINETK
jgi:hypothetical protein